MHQNKERLFSFKGMFSTTFRALGFYLRELFLKQVVGGVTSRKNKRRKNSYHALVHLIFISVHYYYFPKT